MSSYDYYDLGPDPYISTYVSDSDSTDGGPITCRFPEHNNWEIWFMIIIVVFTLILIVFSTKPAIPDNRTIDDGLQIKVDSLATHLLEKLPEVQTVYTVVLEGDGAVRALVYKEKHNNNIVSHQDSLEKGERIYHGIIQAPINLMLMQNDGIFLSLAQKIPTNNGMIWPMEQNDSCIVNYETNESDTLITIRTGMAMGSKYVICALADHYYWHFPGEMYYKLMDLFPDCDPGLPAGFHSRRRELHYAQIVATGNCYRIAPLDIASVYHAIASGGFSKKPYCYLDDAENGIEICSKSIADSLLTLLDCSKDPHNSDYWKFRDFPMQVWGKSATVNNYTEPMWEDEMAESDIFVGSIIQKDIATTVYVYIQYSQGKSTHEQNAVQLFKSIIPYVSPNENLEVCKKS